ncbi:26S proteasome regulatory subunit [Sorochytrium milnesiophthora]
MQVDLDVRRYLQEARQGAQAKRHDQLVQLFNTFEDLYDRKLWHQLTLALEQFVALPEASTYLLSLYENFILDFESKLNKLTLVSSFGLAVARCIGDQSKAIDFLTRLGNKVKPPAPKENDIAQPVNLESLSAYTLAVIESAHYKLLAGELEAVASDIATCQKQLESVDNIDTRVSAAFYRVSADYYKAKGEFAKYYQTALLFLGCLGDKVDEMPMNERVERAHDLSLAALMSPEIYNFGELLMHPILDSLTGTQHDWLRQLLFAFNAGDLTKFDTLSAQFSKMPLLQQNIVFLRMKICLMALIEFVFKRSSDNRSIKFAEIAHETRLPIDEVEHLLMKALSLNLIRGSIDQVDGVALVRWVQPRVLDKQQISGMLDMLVQWQERANDVSRELEAEGGELFVSA